MARDKRSNTQRAAITALGVGAESQEYTPEKFVAVLIAQYEHHIIRARAARDEGMTGRSRVEQGMAYTAASILTDYYQAQGDADRYDLWRTRRDTSEARAFKQRNKIAEHIGAGPEASTPTNEEDLDNA